MLCNEARCFAPFPECSSFRGAPAAAASVECFTGAKCVLLSGKTSSALHTAELAASVSVAVLGFLPTQCLDNCLLFCVASQADGDRDGHFRGGAEAEYLMFFQ